MAFPVFLDLDSYPDKAEHLNNWKKDMNVDEGDLFLTATGALRVAPYWHVFQASVKGRWLGEPLLSAFTREFACVTVSSEAISSASTCWMSNLASYAAEMADGTLYVVGREQECRVAGETLLPIVQSRLASVRLAAPVEADENRSGLESVLALLPALVVLKQNNTIEHAVLRSEGLVECYGEKPIDIVKCQFTPTPLDPLCYIVVDKPVGMPVHPSGRFHKLSVTKILDDVFGGCDAAKYSVVPNELGGATSTAHGGYRIVHSTLGFTIATIGKDVAADAAAVLKSMFPSSILRAHDGFVIQPLFCPLPIRTPHERKGITVYRPFNHASGALKVFVVHRLDIGTSGILLFGLNADSARRMTTVTSEKDSSKLPGEGNTGACHKEYVARVRGDFSAVAKSCGSDAQAVVLLRRPIFCLSYFDSAYACPTDAEILWLNNQAAPSENAAESAAYQCSLAVFEAATSTTPLFPVRGTDQETQIAACQTVQDKHDLLKQLTKGKRTRNGVEDDPVESQFPSLKNAASLFKLHHTVAAQSDESIVICSPLTGRTHQLRVHLAHLGHPIANDEKYIVRPQADHSASAVQSSSLSCAAVFLHSFRYTLVVPYTDGERSKGGGDGAPLPLCFSVAVQTALPAWADIAPTDVPRCICV